MNTGGQVCVLASSRPWNRDMVENLSVRTGRRFVAVTDPDDLVVEKLEALDPRYVFFPHWSHRIDSAVFERFECVIFHMTDLPFGRGGSPLQNLIARGIYETQISALRCVAEMDAGPIYMKRSLSLYGSAEEIYIRASSVIENMIVEIIDKQPTAFAQEGDPTVFTRRKPEDGDLAQAQSLERAFDLIRMLDAEGYPNAFLQVSPLRLEFTRASWKSDHLIADVRITFPGDPIKEQE